ncbi:MAG: hypothetical protein SCALA702_09260 [Melioribacteraceae bacterium]|nr:MAG: hypothetical protein SCALA702_09260 [Melioribacteraceae bacterium]
MKNVTRVLGRVGIIIGIVLGAAVIWFYDFLIPEEIQYPELNRALKVEETLEEKQLSLSEMMPAIFAWHYFQNNTDSLTGMFTSHEGGDIVKMDDIPGYMLAVFSARKLGIISKEEVLNRIGSVLDFLSNVPLTENDNYFAIYSLDSNFVAENYECDITTSLELIALLRSVVVNNRRFSEQAFRLLKNIDIISRLNEYRYTSDIPEITGKVVNLYIKSLQLPDSLKIINTVEHTRYPLDFTPYFMYMQQNIKYWNNEELKIDYLNNETAYFNRDSNYVVFSPLSLGKDEELFYYVSEDSVFSVYSRKMVPVDQKYVATSGAFYRRLVSDDAIAEMIIAGINDLFDPEKGWYEGRLIDSGDIVTYINAHTNAAVLNVLCLNTYKNYY